jgi:RNA polymerase sigma factor (sigma-70 family)
LQAGRAEAAWSLFIDRYRRLIFSAIRHFATDADDVMDVFAHVCESLRRNDLARLRRYADVPSPGARFSTWLVAVVRNLTVDWFRHRDGRPRRAVPTHLTTLQQRVYHSVFVEGNSHDECFGRLQQSDGPAVSAHDFAEALRVTYRVVGRSSTGRAGAELGGSAVSPEHEAEAGDAVQHVSRLLAVLDEADRLAVQLFVVDQLPAAEVARIVGWANAKTVYNRVSRALVKLRGEVERAGLRPGDL